jgi:hypothetical protein
VFPSAFDRETIMASRTGWRARIGWAAFGVAAMVSAPGPRGVNAAADPSSLLVGTWALDREQSEFPADIGFDMPFAGVDAATADTSATRGRGGRQNGSTTSGIPIAHETEQTLKITADVTDEAAHPWPTLVISVTSAEVTIGDGANITRHFHPGKADEQRLADGGITTRAKWDKAALDVDYEVEKDRDVRYTYVPPSATGPLTVTVSFRDHGRGGLVSRRYRKITPGVIFTPRPFSG